MISMLKLMNWHEFKFSLRFFFDVLDIGLNISMELNSKFVFLNGMEWIIIIMRDYFNKIITTAQSIRDRIEWFVCAEFLFDQLVWTNDFDIIRKSSNNNYGFLTFIQWTNKSFKQFNWFLTIASILHVTIFSIQVTFDFI